MVEQEQKDRTGQWFVDAKDPTKWYGPVTGAYSMGFEGEDSYNNRSWLISAGQITTGLYLRIPPRLDLPPGLTTRECRLPKKGERFVNLRGRIGRAHGDYADTGIDDFGWRRWIVEDEPESEAEAKPPCIREIVAAWLKEHGYDGLCNPDRECGCTLDDLIPCIDGLDGETCQAGYKGPVDKYGETMMYLTREAAKAARKEQDDD